MNISCPTCRKDDAIQRVATLVSIGQSSGAYSGPSGGLTYAEGGLGTFAGYTTLHGHSSTELARLLAPPPAPKTYRGYGRIFWPLFVVVGGLVTFFVFPTTCLGLLGLLQGLATQDPSSSVLGIFMSLGTLLVCFGPIAFLGVLFYLSDRSQRTRVQREYAMAKPVWDAAIQRWSRLYFCHRDGVAFDPETQETAEPTNLGALILS